MLFALNQDNVVCQMRGDMQIRSGGAFNHGSRPCTIRGWASGCISGREAGDRMNKIIEIGYSTSSNKTAADKYVDESFLLHRSDTKDGIRSVRQLSEGLNSDDSE